MYNQFGIDVKVFIDYADIGINCSWKDTCILFGEEQPHRGKAQLQEILKNPELFKQ